MAAVVCLICEKLYLGPCYSVVSEKFSISNSLVICPDHEDVKLISKLTTNEDLLSDNARFLIALIKSKKQVEEKQDILNEIDTTRGTTSTRIP